MLTTARHARFVSLPLLVIFLSICFFSQLMHTCGTGYSFFAASHQRADGGGAASVLPGVTVPRTSAVCLGCQWEKNSMSKSTALIFLPAALCIVFASRRKTASWKNAAASGFSNRAPPLYS